jgi:ABC-type dipeptide/oligopeptide/nickel transport system permease component
MTRYILVRLAWAVVTVFSILVINFLVIHLVPGDPIQALVGDVPAPPEYVDSVRRDFGLDQPLEIQLLRYFANLAQGNLGFSFANRQPILELILDRARFTLLLMLPALTLAAILGICLGMFSAKRAGGIADALVSALSVLGYSVPIFWLGQLLILLFAIKLGVLPAQGMVSLRGSHAGIGYALDVGWHLILPTLCVTLYYLAVTARVARVNILQMLHQDFVLTALSKGLSERRVLWRHVLPNALIPVITVIGYNFGQSLTGAILIESVFAWPGLGSLFIASITNRDYPVLEGIFLLTAIAVVLANLITDLLYSVIDPRIRLQDRAYA